MRLFPVHPSFLAGRALDIRYDQMVLRGLVVFAVLTSSRADGEVLGSSAFNIDWTIREKEISGNTSDFSSIGNSRVPAVSYSGKWI